MTNNIINEWEPIRQIRNNKVMSDELYWSHKKLISTSPPDQCRRALFDIHTFSGFEKERFKTITDFLKSIHGLYARSYMDSLLAANAEATVFDENAIGNIDVAAAIALRQIMHCRTSINKVKSYMADKGLDWSYVNTQEAIDMSCDLSEVISKKKTSVCRRKRLSEKEQVNTLTA